MSDPNEARRRLAGELIAEAGRIADTRGIDRDSLEEIRARLRDLAARRELWSVDDFPPPTEDEMQRRYLIAGDEGSGITLYLNVVRSGKRVPPHDHTTWACIAAVEGIEHNMFYTRTDDGAVDGRATLRLDETIAVGPGDAIAMMPDDIHNFEVRGEQIIRHLHFYGRPLETLSERKSFDLEKGTWQIMDIGVKTSTAPGSPAGN